jgi:hypothetical protein
MLCVLGQKLTKHIALLDIYVAYYYCDVGSNVPLSIVRISTNRKHNVSETGSVSVFRRGGAPTLQKNQKLAFPQAMPEQASPVERQAILGISSQRTSVASCSLCCS